MVERADELALQAQRHVPDEAHQHLAGIVVAQQQVPEGLRELGRELGLLEFPDDGVGAVGDEHVTKGLWLLQQPALQQRHLVVEGLDRLGLLEGFELRTRAFERAARVQIAVEVALVERRGFCAHRMISASQLADTRLMRAFNSGVAVTFSSAPGIMRATSRLSPSTMIRVFSKISGSSW